MAGEAGSVRAGVEKADGVVRSGAALALLETLRRPSVVPALNV
jgi:anthranilate phosphoribosyltransferase